MKHSIVAQQAGFNEYLPYIVKAHQLDLQLGFQVVVRFSNGYGASLVKHSFSYGAIEIAVIKFNSKDNEDWEIVYDTPITSDVIGCNDATEAKEVLSQIQALEAK